MRAKQQKRLWVLVDNDEAIDRAMMTDAQAKTANDELARINQPRRWQPKKSFHRPNKREATKVHLVLKKGTNRLLMYVAYTTKKAAMADAERHRFSRKEITVWPVNVESGQARHVYLGRAEADDPIYKEGWQIHLPKSAPRSNAPSKPTPPRPTTTTTASNGNSPASQTQASKTSQTNEPPQMSESQMRAISAELQRTGKMPTLEQYVAAVEEVGNEMRPIMQQVDSDRKAGQDTEDDPVVAELKRLGRPVNRDSYLALALPGGKEKDLSPEEEAQLPQELQNWDRFKK